MKIWSLLLVALLLMVVLSGTAKSANPLTSRELAATAQGSLVFIATRYFDGNTNQTKAAGSGSGVVITSSGLVLTAYHVVKDWDAQSDEDKANNPLRLRLGSSHGDEVDAQIVDKKEQYDVALLQILRPGTYKASGVCFANTLNDGEAVTSFGFPDGLERQSSPGTFGNASADNGRWAVSFNNAEGMSGGPLYDAFGDVVGIIRGTYGGQGASNVVTPVRRARSMIEDQTSFKEECLRDKFSARFVASSISLGGYAEYDPDQDMVVWSGKGPENFNIQLNVPSPGYYRVEALWAAANPSEVFVYTKPLTGDCNDPHPNMDGAAISYSSSDTGGWNRSDLPAQPDVLGDVLLPAGKTIITFTSRSCSGGRLPSTAWVQVEEISR